MANRVAPFGLAPHEYLNGAKWVGACRTYYIPSSDGNAFAIGDPVVLSGTGSSAGVPAVTLATAGSTNLVLGSIVGVGGKAFGGAIGVNPLGNQDTTVIPATKTVGYHVMVADDPWIVYAVMEDSAQSALAVTDIGLNISLKAGTNNGYQSAWVLDQSTKATTAALQMKIIGLLQQADNAVGTAAVWLCLINQHQYKGTVAGV